MNKKKGTPSWTSDGVVMGWRLDDNQQVPAIEQSRIAVVKFPVDYYQHFDYGPELMMLRRERIKELGWSSVSFDLPRMPSVVGEFSLLSNAIKKVVSVLDSSSVYADRIYPSIITLTSKGYGRRSDYCVLYFNGAAYEFYDLLFAIGLDTVVFENVPNPKIKTLNQLLQWSKSFEFKRRKLYKSQGFSWEPVSLSKGGD